MTESSERRIARSVDSLQKIYSVVIALAIGQAIQTFLIDRPAGTLAAAAVVLGRTPAFLALLAILVPFYHGMNRHLDVVYIERPQEQRAEAALLFDFVVFFFESCLLFAVAYSVGPGLAAFAFLGTLLAVDVLWALASHWIHYTRDKQGIFSWAAINAAAIVLGLFVGLTEYYSTTAKGWLLLVVAIGRTVFDYWFYWQFYFPRDRVTQSTR
jgi:hypothetical protein